MFFSEMHIKRTEAREILIQQGKKKYFAMKNWRVQDQIVQICSNVSFVTCDEEKPAMEVVNRQERVIQRSHGAAAVWWAFAWLWSVSKGSMAVRDSFKGLYCGLGAWPKPTFLWSGRGRERFARLSPACRNPLPGPGLQRGLGCVSLLNNVPLGSLNGTRGQHLTLLFVSKLIKLGILSG